MLQQLRYNRPFVLENQFILPELTIAYHTYGQLNTAKNNVIWICHALTGNSDAADWWDGLVGTGKVFDPAKFFIVCVNMLGSCYGATNARSINPTTGQAYHKDFPVITTRDMVRVQQILQTYLGLTKIKLLIGGSMGGQQALEWAIETPTIIENLCVLATNAQHSPWGIAFNEAQRMAILADPTTYDNTPTAGQKGLAAARAIAMVSYRSYETYQESQSETNNEQLDNFRASSYQRYQGQKLQERFDVLAYLSLSKAMDNHNVGRGRGSVTTALNQIQARTLIIGIESDILFPIHEQVFLSKHIPNAFFTTINSIYGHDGFLVEYKLIEKQLKQFLAGQNLQRKATIFTDLPGSESF